MLGEPVRGVGEPHAAADALEQRHAGLALELGQLLRDGGRRVGQRVGDRGDRPALAQLAQQAQRDAGRACSPAYGFAAGRSTRLSRVGGATMRRMTTALTIRPARPADAAGLADLAAPRLAPAR